jgi:hypothetical protein
MPTRAPSRSRSKKVQESGEDRSAYDQSRGARPPANPSGERKQGGRKPSRKSVGQRVASTGNKRSGSESGGGKQKKKARGGTKGGTRGGRGR